MCPPSVFPLSKLVDPHCPTSSESTPTEGIATATTTDNMPGTRQGLEPREDIDMALQRASVKAYHKARHLQWVARTRPSVLPPNQQICMANALVSEAVAFERRTLQRDGAKHILENGAATRRPFCNKMMVSILREDVSVLIYVNKADLTHVYSEVAALPCWRVAE